MPRVSAVGDSALWAAKGKAVDYATRELWWANEAAVDYSGLPIVAEMLGDCGSNYTLSGASVNGAVSYTKDVTHDGTNTSDLSISKNITISVTNLFEDREIKYESTNRYTLGINLQSDSYSSERCVYQQVSSAGGTAIVVAGHYPNSEIKNFLAFGGTTTVRAGYKQGTNFKKGLVYGSGGTGVDSNYAEMVLTDIFAFNNVTDYLGNSTKINCASQDNTGTPGLTGYTSAELFDFATGDIRIKSTSPLAAAGIGAFIQQSEQTSPIFSFSSTINLNQQLSATTLKAINHADELSQAVALTAFNIKSININASINQNQALQALNVKCLMLSTELLQGQQLQAEKSKKIAVSGDIQQSYAMQGFFQNGTTEIHQFNATISVTPINSAKFNKNVKQESQKSQSIVLTGQAIKRSALQLNINQATLLAANAYKHVNVNAELQQKLVTSAIFFNAAQPLYLRKFRINGEIVFQRFNGATVKQRFNGALN